MDQRVFSHHDESFGFDLRLLLLLVAAPLLLMSPHGLWAQGDLINCQDFTSDFKTTTSCLDGSQPSSGPIPQQPEIVEDDDLFDDGMGFDDGVGDGPVF